MHGNAVLAPAPAILFPFVHFPISCFVLLCCQLTDTTSDARCDCRCFLMVSWPDGKALLHVLTRQAACISKSVQTLPPPPPPPPEVCSEECACIHWPVTLQKSLQTNKQTSNVARAQGLTANKLYTNKQPQQDGAAEPPSRECSARNRASVRIVGMYTRIDR